MGFSKPQVTIDLEEYQQLLNIKNSEDRIDDAALKVLNRLLSLDQVVSNITTRRVIELGIRDIACDVKYKEENGRIQILKISNK
jgi:hypothetical protein